jgi:bacteriorhodopsin
MSVLEKSAYFSLFLQFITGLIDIWGLNLQVPENFNIFRQLLAIELVVQIIEFVFYVWMVFQFVNKSKKIKNITVYRYFDWFVTTPSMLLTLMAYLSFDRNQSQTSIVDFIKQNYKVIFTVWILNAAMLFMGLVGELGWMDPKKSALIGFVPFVLYFYIIYKYFVQDKQLSNEKRNVFFYFLIVWSLYGVAALLPYEAKNTMYNILDLFAKNFFGLFLVYILYQESTSASTSIDVV